MGEPIYEMNYSLGQEENSLVLFPDRIRIRKPKNNTAHGFLGVIKKELRMQGIIKTEYIGIDVPFSRIESIYLKPASVSFIRNGIIIIYLKGQQKNSVNYLNCANADNAFNFWGEHNKTAEEIKKYIEKHM